MSTEGTRIQRYIWGKLAITVYLLFLTFRPPFGHKFFFCFFRTGVFVARHLRHLFVSGFVKNTLNTVINISRITSKVLTFRVIVKEALLKILLPIQRRQCWQKWTLFISYRDNFRPTPFCALEKKIPARVTRNGTICLANLTISVEDTKPNPLLEKVSTYSLPPRFWFLVRMNITIEFKKFMFSLRFFSLYFQLLSLHPVFLAALIASTLSSWIHI